MYTFAFSFIYGLEKALIYGLCLTLFYFLLLFVKTTRGWLKVKKRNKLKGPIRILFYKDFLEFKDEDIHVKVKYEKLDKLIETKTSFYMMLDSFSGIVLLKDQCEQGLISFLTDSIKPKVSK